MTVVLRTADRPCRCPTCPTAIGLRCFARRSGNPENGSACFLDHPVKPDDDLEKQPDDDTGALSSCHWALRTLNCHCDPDVSGVAISGRAGKREPRHLGRGSTLCLIAFAYGTFTGSCLR
ncbi:MAG TPA: hypothetical protein VMX96_04310 [Dehalococcoidia bacterium]|nr:hypothetical protein [Dehalococcoidia bacterium]